MTDLPVLYVLPELIAALDAGRNAVLVAPPGAGKTTAVAPALLDRPWAEGQRILLLSPRRLAARAAAERMASLRGEPAGRTIGYRTRLDSKISAATRVEVLTEGVFTNLIQRDPELAGVAAVLFDEVHERSLEGDFGLALALDAQGALRPDLRIVAMSATLDGAKYARLLDGPVIEAQGRMYPVAHRYLGRRADERIEDAVARAIGQALREEEGSLLAFLPGAAEIERTAERLAPPADVEVHKLYGALDGSVQRAAIEPAPAGRRKVVLATSIAETSLTIDGVRVVIDSGLARRPRYERATGLTRLVTERASQAAVAQRAGRAGRTAPGVAWRLWEEGETRGLPPFDPPEILESDLTGLVLDLAIWGVADPGQLQWLDPPPAAAVAEARDRLKLLDAIDADARPTEHGKRIAGLPLPPRLAHMLVAGAELGIGTMAAKMAVLITERGLGGRDADAETRLRNWDRSRDRRSQAAAAMAQRWVKLVGAGRDEAGGDAAGLAIALAYPDRVARRRGDAWLMRNGRAVKLDAADPLAKQEWLAVAEASGAAAGARILLAAPIELATVERLFGGAIEKRQRVSFDTATGAVSAEETRSLGAITLARRPVERPDPAAITGALLDGVRATGLDKLPWSEGAQALRGRVAFLREGGEELPDLSDAALLDRLDDWLAPLLAGKRRLESVDAGALAQAVENLLDWSQRQTLDRQAPTRLSTPAGTSHAIDYAAEGGPAVELRVQELFGLAEHPVIGRNRVPLTLVLLSPAYRPIQKTRDLPGFWRGSWRAVQAEMKGRYPKHPWPDDPAAAKATTRTKNAAARDARHD
ncbi:ATP-dependent helicase HrpB [Sphingoaurantiacus capsulatus]|uniref:ATP-dependent helicase HrpB n=1 Tax=Sphingoaurantiacus capsulatus TaxID=1771310 RepID=A0ABV7XE01_9SPHN